MQCAVHFILTAYCSSFSITSVIFPMTGLLRRPRQLAGDQDLAPWTICFLRVNRIARSSANVLDH